VHRARAPVHRARSQVDKCDEGEPRRHQEVRRGGRAQRLGSERAVRSTSFVRASPPGGTQDEGGGRECPKPSTEHALRQRYSGTSPRSHYSYSGSKRSRRTERLIPGRTSRRACSSQRQAASTTRRTGVTPPTGSSTRTSSTGWCGGYRVRAATSSSPTSPRATRSRRTAPS